MGAARLTCDFIKTYLEALVLQHALDGGVFARRRQLGLEDNTKGAIADNLALGVLHLLGLAGQAVLDLLADDFCIGGLAMGATRATEWCACGPRTSHSQARKGRRPVL